MIEGEGKEVGHTASWFCWLVGESQLVVGRQQWGEDTGVKAEVRAGFGHMLTNTLITHTHMSHMAHSSIALTFLTHPNYHR